MKTLRKKLWTHFPGSAPGPLTTTDIWVAQLHPSQTLTTVRAMVLFYLQYTTINKTRIL